MERSNENDYLVFQESRCMPDLIHCTQMYMYAEGADGPGKVYERQGLINNVTKQYIEPAGVPLPVHVQEIKEYLTSHESWEVPDSVLYEEPIDCDLVICPELTDDNGCEIENDLVQAKARKRGGRRHRGPFMKRPMAMAEVIEELQNHDLRENALRCLSGHLIERREDDPEFYRQAGFFLFHSCGTLAILLQELLATYERFYAGDLNVRGSKRLANVLTLFQSIAANNETRPQFVKACIPNYLIPFIRSEYTEEVYENLRAISLSIVGILCQARETEVIQWALHNEIIEMCFFTLDIGSELSKVISMTILDSILRVSEGLSAVCEPSLDLLPKFINMCADLVSLLAVVRGFSPRLLFLVVRSCILLCQNSRALELLKEQLPPQLQDTTFLDVKMEYPIFSHLRHQLLLNTGKARDYLPSAPGSLQPSPASLGHSSDDKENTPQNTPPFKQMQETTVVTYLTPLCSTDFNKGDWFASASQSVHGV